MTDPSVEHYALTARSVIATALLGAGVGARLPVAQLVRAGSLFGVSDTAVRTALSRMAATGELEVDERGRYRLAGRLLEREQRVDESQVARRRRWDGTWEIAVVRDERRPVGARRELRAAAVALRLAELREGTWVRPRNLDPDRFPGHQAVLSAQCVRFSGAVTADVDVGDLFDLPGWAERADQLLAQMDTWSAEPSAPVLAGFELSIAVVRHLQADPLLPDELLPPGWPGPRLRVGYAAHDTGFKQALNGRLSASSAAGTGPGPPEG